MMEYMNVFTWFMEISFFDSRSGRAKKLSTAQTRFNGALKNLLTLSAITC